MDPQRLDESLQVDEPLAKNRVFGKWTSAPRDRFRQREQAIEALFAAAGGAEHVALMKERGVRDDPSFVELGDQVSTRPPNVVHENSLQPPFPGHLPDPPNGDS